MPDGPTTPVDFGRGTSLKRTSSICPVCLERVVADVYERDGEVWMDKRCDEHGPFSALLASDARHYYVADPRLASVGSCCGGGGCGPSSSGDNHSCNLLIEVTQRCNLRCPTCYADSSPDKDQQLSLEQFHALLDDLIAQGKGSSDLIQLSGGEPTLHPDMFAMVERAIERGIKKVYINTNGIRLARPEFAERLAAYGDRVAVYLQLDGVRRDTFRILRDREDLGEVKRKALANCEAFGLDAVPVMTVAPGVNDDEIGAVLELALAHPKAVSRLMIQPAMYSGRYEPPQRVRRSTVADVAKQIAAATGVFDESDFSPIPCSDPNCFSMAVALRTDEGLIPVSRYFPRYPQWGDEGTKDLVASVSDTFDSAADLGAVLQWAVQHGALAELDGPQLDGLLASLAAWQKRSASWGDVFAIGIKPFMDAYTYDQDRVDACCVHIVSRDGRPVSFCEYNAVTRPRGLG